MSATPANIAKNRRRLLRLYNSLLKHFGPRAWWAAETPWEMIVGAFLTQNTNWGNVKKALDNLRAAKALTLERFAQLPRKRLERLIHPAGFFRQKAERLQHLARYCRSHPDFYRQLLGTSRDTPLTALRKSLLTHKGVGPETADSILLYAGAYPTFVVDAYTRRIGRRVGLFRYDDYHRVQAYFEQALPREAPLYNEFHALIVWLAKHYCKSRKPLCGKCPLTKECRYGRDRRLLHR